MDYLYAPLDNQHQPINHSFPSNYLTRKVLRNIPVHYKWIKLSATHNQCWLLIGKAIQPQPNSSLTLGNKNHWRCVLVPSQLSASNVTMQHIDPLHKHLKYLSIPRNQHFDFNQVNQSIIIDGNINRTFSVSVVQCGLTSATSGRLISNWRVEATERDISFRESCRIVN